MDASNSEDIEEIKNEIALAKEQMRDLASQLNKIMLLIDSRNLEKLANLDYRKQFRKFGKRFPFLLNNQKSVFELDLSVRSFNSLWNGGIRTFDQLSQVSETGIYKLKNMGIKSIAEVLDRLNSILDESHQDHIDG